MLRRHPETAGPPGRNRRPAAQTGRRQRLAPQGTRRPSQEPGRLGFLRSPDQAGNAGSAGRRWDTGSAGHPRNTGAGYRRAGEAGQGIAHADLSLAALLEHQHECRRRQQCRLHVLRPGTLVHSGLGARGSPVPGRVHVLPRPPGRPVRLRPGGTLRAPGSGRGVRQL